MRLRRDRARGPIGADVVFDVDEAFEQRVELMARLVMQLTVLADRYERAVGDGAPAATATRVARLRRASESGRETLVGLVLWDQPGAAPAAGESGGDGLGGALNARTAIGQAQGVLMYRGRIGAAEALELLLGAARDSGLSLGQVAREVVSAGWGPRPEVGPAVPADGDAAASRERQGRHDG